MNRAYDNLPVTAQMVRMCRTGSDSQFTDVCRAWLAGMLEMSEQGNLTYGSPEAFREALGDLPQKSRVLIDVETATAFMQENRISSKDIPLGIEELKRLACIQVPRGMENSKAMRFVDEVLR